MNPIMPGRFTAQITEPFVVFMLGIRLNRLLAVHKWLPIMNASNQMLIAQSAQPPEGYLGGESWFHWRGVTLMQYWRSFDALERYAHDTSQQHLPGWRLFNRSIGADGSIGIWHETYAVQPGQWESIYVNMPLWGLAHAAERVPVHGRRNAARARMEAAPTADLVTLA